MGNKHSICNDDLTETVLQQSGCNDNGVVLPNGVLPPMAGGNPNRKTLVLDLDATLVHTSLKPMPAGYHFTIQIPGYRQPFYVLKRPGVDELLLQLGATGLYEILLFTAASRVYADVVVDGLLDSLRAIDSSDEHKNIKMNIIPPTHRLSSSHCRKVEGLDYVKDLSLLGRDLKNIIFVDDRPASYYLQPRNAIPINPWVGTDFEDKSLFNITSFCLEHVEATTDVRDLISYYMPSFLERKIGEV